MYASLLDIPKEIHVDVVDVFRRAEHTPEVARDAVAIGARVLWLQEGIVSEEAARIAVRGRPRGDHGCLHHEGPRTTDGTRGKLR